MKSRTSESSDGLSSLPVPQDFSLVLGGPLFQLLLRAHMSDDALTLVRQRIIVIALLAWLPLLVLSTLEGQVLGGSVTVPFLLDVEVHVRFLLCVVIGPLLVFTPQLAQAKRTGLREYGALTERYVREFDAKWLRGGAPADEPLVGSGDIQSLADLGNSLEVVRTMRLAPITKEAILRLVVATLAPIVPLALTMMPLEELLKTLAGVLF